MSKNNNEIVGENPTLEYLITLPEAARVSGLSHDHLRRLAGRGDLWAKKIGRDWMTTERAIKEYDYVCGYRAYSNLDCSIDSEFHCKLRWKKPNFLRALYLFFYCKARLS